MRKLHLAELSSWTFDDPNLVSHRSLLCLYAPTVDGTGFTMHFTLRRGIQQRRRARQLREGRDEEGKESAHIVTETAVFCELRPRPLIVVGGIARPEAWALCRS